MVLRFIERGTVLSIFEEVNHQAVSETFEAAFYDLQNETSFVVSSPGLRGQFDKLGSDARLNIRFTRDSTVYTFTGRVRELLYGGPGDLVLIEQTTGIETLNRREHPRDEIRVEVKFYGLEKERLVNKAFAQPSQTPDLVDMSYDISAGGMCVISNVFLNSPHDPYYLVEFKVGRADGFLLPAEIVRRRDSTQSWLGRYDYGLRFIYDGMPDEKSRLITAIFNTKLSQFG